jgi:hypothetical protein
LIKPRSLLKEYTLIWSGDPALTLPTDEKAREHALKVAAETGDWRALINGNEQPTYFHVSPLTGSQFDWWMGEVSRRKLIVAEGAVLALRLALKRVENFGDHQVAVQRDSSGHTLASMDIIDAIYAECGGAGRDVIVELGNAIIERAQAPLSPKS